MPRYFSENGKYCISVVQITTMIKTHLSMTVRGVLSPRSARFNQGQYITSFCFYGDGFIKHDLSQTSKGKLYIYSENRWNTAKELPCQEKLSAAEFSFELANVSGEHRFVPWEMINYWHIVYADPNSCDQSSLALHDDLSYTMYFLNKDSQGNPLNHFSYDKAGLLFFFKVVSIIYFICASFYGQGLWHTIRKEGPMHQVIKDLSVGVTYHGSATFLMLTSLLWYAKDGNENIYLSSLVIVFQCLAEYKMMSMSIRVSYGWMLGSSKNKADDTLSRQIQLFVGICVLLEIFLLFWNHTILLSIIKCAVVGVVVFNTRGCCVWFLALPVSTLLTFFLPSYHKLKVVVIVQRIAEIVAIGLLYRLFLSRSLYWEVSSLSSATLPLRFDRTFGKKSYDTYKR
ncbi:integral membrane protein GPR180-like [Xenia sp. Carnegie-2017]|uniref:integral membrane protein GPR180-like n=1 Tax=Xenia sp. Carnegie-2017 TaxID=2897299 RepID=UPI001F03761D|nr:integral membrane protein GPR180-like [Xenia sp. Carnegie-2017]